MHISAQSSSWFTLWVCMEINLLSFIPLMRIDTKLKSNQWTHPPAAIHYFLIQALGSACLLISLLFSLIREFYTLGSASITIFILWKAGSAPFHFWYVTLIEQLSWFSIYFLRTAQKFIPLLRFIYRGGTLLTLAGVANLIVGTVNRVQLNNIKLLIIYSSVYSIGWFLLAIRTREKLIFFRIFALYSIAIGILCVNLAFSGTRSYSVSTRGGNHSYDALRTLIVLLILAGIPPWAAFYYKTLILGSLINRGIIFVAFTAGLTSIILLDAYLKLLIGPLIGPKFFSAGGTRSYWIVFGVTIVLPFIIAAYH